MRYDILFLPIFVIIANVQGATTRGGMTATEENQNHIDEVEFTLNKFAFQCVTEGWEKEDCLQASGCVWCDTKDFGGACVTDAFESHVKDWSYFTCIRGDEQDMFQETMEV